MFFFTFSGSLCCQSRVSTDHRTWGSGMVLRDYSVEIPPGERYTVAWALQESYSAFWKVS